MWIIDICSQRIISSESQRSLGLLDILGQILDLSWIVVASRLRVAVTIVSVSVWHDFLCETPTAQIPVGIKRERERERDGYYIGRCVVCSVYRIDAVLICSIDHLHPFLSFSRSVQLRLLLSVFDCLEWFDESVFCLRVKEDWCSVLCWRLCESRFDSRMGKACS